MADTLIPNADEQSQAQWRLLRAQIAHFEKAARWEPYKAIAAMAAGVALFGGLVVALSNWHQPQTVTVHFDAPLAVQLPAPKGG